MAGNRRVGLVAARKAAGFTQERLAWEVGVQRETVVRWEEGRHEPSPYVRPKLARLLGRTLRELDDLINPRPASISAAHTPIPASIQAADDEVDEEAAAYVMAHPRRVDLAAVDSLAVVLAQQRRLEDAIGSAAMLGPALGQLKAVEQLVRAAHGPVRPALVEVAAQWAQFGGWLHVATGRYDAAARRFDQALGWAAETGDVQMTATALSFHGYLAERAGLPGPMVGVTRAAMRDRGVYVGQRAYDALQAARGHAMSGDRLDVAAALAEAGDLAAEFAEYHGPTPPWQYYRSPGFFVMERGLVHRILGRHDRDANDRAVQDLTAGLAALPTEQRRAEWAAEYELQLARAFAQGGDQVSAQRVLDQVRVVAEATGSARLHAEAGKLTRQLAR